MKRKGNLYQNISYYYNYTFNIGNYNNSRTKE